MLDVLLWYFWTQAFAFAGWLIASQWLRNLPDRGYAISKALGVMLGGFAYWALVTLGFSMNNVGAALLALAVVWGAGFALRFANQGQKTKDNLDLRSSFVPSLDASGPSSGQALRPSSSVIIVTEILFAFAFVGWAVVRAYSPDIMSSGGEKFMESMMINAILRNPTFPPNDAWMSGFSISYYYFGYIIFAMLIKLSGVAPSVGFNLGGAMIFALTVTSAFSIGYNLWQRRQSSVISHRASGIAGLLTVLMLTLMGNMGGLMGALKCGNVLPQSFWQWLDLSYYQPQEGLSVPCNGLAPSSFYGGGGVGWWWAWSRVVHDYTPTGQTQEAITETPIFSFVLGDNHPHVMALPFVLIALTLALDAFRNGAWNTEYEPRALRIAYFVILPAIVLGGLSFMNTWDFPIYGAIFIGASLLGRWLRREPLLPAFLYGIGVIALGYLIYLPWSVTFSSQARGIGVNLFNGTRFIQFFLIYAPFLIAAAGFIWLTARDVRVPARSVVGHAAGLTAVVIIACLAAMVVFGLISPQGRAMVQELNEAGTVMGVTREQVSQRLIERVTNPWTVLVLGAGAATCAVLILSTKRQSTVAQSDSSEDWRIPVNPQDDANGGMPSLAPLDAFILLLFGAGALLTLGVEFVFLQDLFGSRMNTLFKFYYQAWTLWSVAGAFAIMRLFTACHTTGKVIGGVALVFVAFGLIYPFMAIPARTNNFVNQPTLDGAAYLQRDNPDDAKMIDWLNTNVSDDVHIVEAPAQAPNGAYAYEGRTSAFTGVPTILGWGGHQHQWRGSLDEPIRRLPLVEQIYNSTDPIETRSLLKQFDVRYVIVGETERARFAPDGLAKFETMCTTAFQSGTSAIYRCAD